MTDNSYLNQIDREYHSLLKDILSNGYEKGDRTGTGTFSVFGRTLTFDLYPNILPLLTTKKIITRSIIYELLWFLQGRTNINWLNERDVHIWDEWADDNGELGPIYGKQWRDFGGVDQIKQVENKLHTKPDDRRMLVKAYNVSEIDQMNLPPCHTGFMLYTRELTHKERLDFRNNHAKVMKLVAGDDEESLDKQGIPRRELSLMWDQRSCDFGLGIPFNIASYALLMHMFCRDHNFVPGSLIGQLGDCHIYKNHIDQISKQLEKSSKSEPPTVDIKKRNSVTDHLFDDITINNYDHHPGIKMPVAV